MKWLLAMFLLLISATAVKAEQPSQEEVKEVLEKLEVALVTDIGAVHQLLHPEAIRLKERLDETFKPFVEFNITRLPQMDIIDNETVRIQIQYSYRTQDYHNIPIYTEYVTLKKYDGEWKIYDTTLFTGRVFKQFMIFFSVIGVIGLLLLVGLGFAIYYLIKHLLS